MLLMSTAPDAEYNASPTRDTGWSFTDVSPGLSSDMI